MRKDIRKELQRRVLVLDGAMATMIQHLGGGAGCYDAMVFSNPELIMDIHLQYIDAGADIITTDSFNANALSLAEYGLSDRAYDINLAAARLARSAAGDEIYVAGSMGPGCVSLSMSETISFEDMEAACYDQARGLINGGVDLLLIETAVDPMNVKAAIAGARRAMGGNNVPLMVSAAINGQGRLPSGLTLDDFIGAVSPAHPLAIGLNCGLGVEMMLPYVEQLQEIDCYVSLHPSAGLPDTLGKYPRTPHSMALTLRGLLERGKLNIVGGCCGTTPRHIRALAHEARNAIPRKPPLPAPTS